jgi:hypothetical protein
MLPYAPAVAYLLGLLFSMLSICASRGSFVTTVGLPLADVTTATTTTYLLNTEVSPLGMYQWQQEHASKAGHGLLHRMCGMVNVVRCL